jgi:hypothetical protein
MDLDYVREKLFQAVDCLAGAEDLTKRLICASDFISRVGDSHFPLTPDGERQRAKFQAIRERLLGADLPTARLKSLVLNSSASSLMTSWV